MYKILLCLWAVIIFPYLIVNFAGGSSYLHFVFGSFLIASQLVLAGALVFDSKE